VVYDYKVKYMEVFKNNFYKHSYLFVLNHRNDNLCPMGGSNVNFFCEVVHPCLKRHSLLSIVLRFLFDLLV
jgi:hypothetical protein